MRESGGAGPSCRGRVVVWGSGGQGPANRAMPVPGLDSRDFAELDVVNQSVRGLDGEAEGVAEDTEVVCGALLAW